MPKKKKKKRSTPRAPAPTRGPAYMVQVEQPETLRKDILESLRETILFQQSYDGFRKLQAQKVDLFTTLKSDVKELGTLIDQLNKLLPKGKLKAVTYVPTPSMSTPMAKSAPLVAREMPPKPAGDLDNLEQQLRSIEAQLQKMG